MNWKKVKMKKIVIIILFVCITIFSYIFIFSQDSLSREDIIQNIVKDIDKAPDFTLQALNDSIYTLSKMKGKVILVNFWATWCGPCRMEIPEFNELYKKYSKNGFEILGVSISDSKKQLENFAKSFEVNYPLLHGTAKEMNKIMSEYGGVYAVPSSFLIGKSGTIIWSFPGAILKKYDPETYATLVYKIEKEINFD